MGEGYITRSDWSCSWACMDYVVGGVTLKTANCYARQGIQITGSLGMCYERIWHRQRSVISEVKVRNIRSRMTSLKNMTFIFIFQRERYQKTDHLPELHDNSSTPSDHRAQSLWKSCDDRRSNDPRGCPSDWWIKRETSCS